MERLKKIISDTVFVIQVLIIFVLLFENRVELPAIFQAFGRLHPLLLHLPIGLLLVTVILLYTRPYFEGKGFDDFLALLLHFTALTASLTTIMGLFLSLEGTFSADEMWLHKWLGIALSFLCWGLLGLKHKINLLKPLGFVGVIILIFTGHYGAALTHGDNFLLAPLEEDAPKVIRIITDSTEVFKATVEPILESKCYGCHNSKKAKGNLILTSLEGIEKGGKNGPLWEAKDAANSLIVERLLLPLDHDDHMPPKDKAQLTEDEIAFISLWIDSGANTQRKLYELPKEDTLGKLASLIIPRYQALPTDFQKYTFQFAAPEKIEKLKRPNRSVFQIARNEPAVQADFFLSETFEPKYLEELLDVKDQLISLNVSKMPVQDQDMKTIAKFPNLEVLNLNNTEITGAGLRELTSLPRLRSLSVSGTKISKEDLMDLASAKGLKEVFVWNTPISQEDVADLETRFPGIRWDIGFIPDEEEVLKLNSPMIKNKQQVLNPGEKVTLKHNLPGTIIRYTLDGTEPDSINSPVYEQPLITENFATVKAKAYKDGWFSSDVVEFVFFRKGIRPDSAKLVSSPNDRYPGEGISTLLDTEKGIRDYYRHPAWIAFRETDLIMDFSFEKDPHPVKNITLSFAHNVNAICFPPDQMQLWGGNDPRDLKLLVTLDPPRAEKPKKVQIEGMSMDVRDAHYKYYRLIAKPEKTPPGENSRERAPWLMVDEVFIN